MFGKVSKVGVVVLLVAWFVASIGGNLVFVGTAEAQGPWGGPIYTPDYSFGPNQVVMNGWSLRYSSPVWNGVATGGSYYGGPNAGFMPGPYGNRYSGFPLGWAPYTGYVLLRGNPGGAYN